MALTPIGFDTEIDENAWASWSPELGKPPHVLTYNDFLATVDPSGDRLVKLSMGKAHAYGVGVQSSTDEVVQGNVVAAGNRWDTIVLRRNWDDNSVSLVVIPGTSAAVVASAALTSPADVANGLADQLLWLVRFAAGQQIAAEMVDLRSFASPVVAISDLRAIPDSQAHQGMEVVRSTDGQRYRRVRSGSGVLTWQPSGVGGRTEPTVYTGSSVLFTGSPAEGGWTGGQIEDQIRADVIGNMARVRFALRRSSGSVPAGDIADRHICTLRPHLRPIVTEYMDGQTAGGVPAKLMIGTDGAVYLRWTQNGVSQSASNASVVGTFVYPVREA